MSVRDMAQRVRRRAVREAYGRHKLAQISEEDAERLAYNVVEREVRFCNANWNAIAVYGESYIDMLVESALEGIALRTEYEGPAVVVLCSDEDGLEMVNLLPPL